MSFLKCPCFYQTWTSARRVINTPVTLTPSVGTSTGHTDVYAEMATPAMVPPVQVQRLWGFRIYV